VVTEYLSPAASGDVELHFAQGALSQPADVRLTPLSPQGLIAPAPLGWSVLLGADVRVEPVQSAVATLTVPTELVLPGVSLTLVAALWDEAAMSWLAAAPVTVDGGVIEVEIDVPGQVALLVGDDEPSLVAVPGQPLPGLPAVAAAVGPFGSVVADPQVIFSSTAARARIFAEVSSAEALVSGTVIEARLDESYSELRSQLSVPSCQLSVWGRVPTEN
jgi:hypothetical protein